MPMVVVDVVGVERFAQGYAIILFLSLPVLLSFPPLAGMYIRAFVPKFIGVFMVH